MAETDKTNVQVILKLLPDEDVFELMKTVTGKVDKSSRSSAEEAILKGTSSREEFFKRVKITKALLTRYIFKLDWNLPKGEKKELIDYITQKWDTADISKKNPSNESSTGTMSSEEKELCRAILKSFPHEKDLLELVTAMKIKGFDKNCYRGDAEDAVLNTTKSFAEFFKHQKLNKEFLLKFVHSQGWDTIRADKNSLIDYIRQKWKVAEDGKGGPSHGRKGGVKRSSDSGTPSSSKMFVMSKSGKSSDADNSHKTDDSMRGSYHFTITLRPGDMTAATKLEEEKKPAVPSQTPDSSDFFYHYLKCFGPNLFHHDSELILTWKKSKGSISETLFGKDIVANRILALSQADKIEFSWSLDDSKVKSFSSGKVAIYFCGNLQKDGNRFGVFYQGCLLLKVNVSVSGQDEWLIKYTMLKIREGLQVSPSLNDNDAVALEEGTSAAVNAL